MNLLVDNLLNRIFITKIVFKAAMLYLTNTIIYLINE